MNLKVKNQRIKETYQINNIYLFEKISKNKYKFLKSKNKIRKILNNVIYSYIGNVILLFLIIPLLPLKEFINNNVEAYPESISLFVLLVFFTYMFFIFKLIIGFKSAVSAIYLKIIINGKNKKKFKNIPKFVLNGLIKKK